MIKTNYGTILLRSHAATANDPVPSVTACWRVAKTWGERELDFIWPGFAQCPPRQNNKFSSTARWTSYITTDYTFSTLGHLGGSGLELVLGEAIRTRRYSALCRNHGKVKPVGEKTTIQLGPAEGEEKTVCSLSKESKIRDTYLNLGEWLRPDSRWHVICPPRRTRTRASWQSIGVPNLTMMRIWRSYLTKSSHLTLILPPRLTRGKLDCPSINMEAGQALYARGNESPGFPPQSRVDRHALLMLMYKTSYVGGALCASVEENRHRSHDTSRSFIYSGLHHLRRSSNFLFSST
jgi:hypothetical protein